MAFWPGRRVAPKSEDVAAEKRDSTVVLIERVGKHGVYRVQARGGKLAGDQRVESTVRTMSREMAKVATEN